MSAQGMLVQKLVCKSDFDISSSSLGKKGIVEFACRWGKKNRQPVADDPRGLFTHQGRNGLGNIYVWASGDGGEEDDCNCDGYAASMWTISINSAINDGQNAHYDESCSSTLASTFSNGAKDPNTGVVSGSFVLGGETSFGRGSRSFLRDAKQDIEKMLPEYDSSTVCP